MSSRDTVRNSSGKNKDEKLGSKRDSRINYASKPKTVPSTATGSKSPSQPSSKSTMNYRTNAAQKTRNAKPVATYDSHVPSKPKTVPSFTTSSKSRSRQSSRSDSLRTAKSATSSDYEAKFGFKERSEEEKDVLEDEEIWEWASDVVKTCADAELAKEIKKLMEEITEREEKMKVLIEEEHHKELRRRVDFSNQQNLKGKIRVFCRIRPALQSEKSLLQYEINYINKHKLAIKSLLEDNSDSRHNISLQPFSFDRIFKQESTQEQVFSELAELVQSVLNGDNVCMFVYGETGSGKTYTMEGQSPETTLGIIPRVIDFIYKFKNDMKFINWDYTFSVCFLQIKNEKIDDLLEVGNKNLRIKMADPKGIHIENLTRRTARSSCELKKYLAIAQRNRSLSGFQPTETSSGIHFVAQIQVEGVNTARNIQTQSYLHLVDLAGSEHLHIKQTDRFEINRSLATLSHILLFREEKTEYVPFKRSKLTHVLMPFLHGGCKISIVFNIAPFEECYMESLRTLKFAAYLKR